MTSNRCKDWTDLSPKHHAENPSIHYSPLTSQVCANN
jgi:hypothetical protein